MNRHSNRLKRVRRIRAKVFGTSEKPRLSVYRSLTHISAQLIDDTNGTTLVSASDRGSVGTRVEKAKAVGRQLAEKAKQKKISNVVFDRSGYQFHGQVAALAEGAREAGLTF